MKTVVLFNGPPGSGKDALAEYLTHYNEINTAQDMFKYSLYKLASQVSGVPLHIMRHIAIDRVLKEAPSPYLTINGVSVSPRQWLIHISENVVKPLVGKSYFGDQLRQRVEESDAEIIVVSDSGFEEEALALLGIPNTKIACIRIHRPGYSYANDSRNYLSDEFLERNNIDFIDLVNDWTLEEFLSAGKGVVNSWHTTQ